MERLPAPRMPTTIATVRSMLRPKLAKRRYCDLYDKDAVNGNLYTPLYTAVEHGRVGAAKALLAAGADTDVACGKLHSSALHQTVLRDNADCMGMLIENRADVDAVHIYGSKALRCDRHT